MIVLGQFDIFLGATLKSIRGHTYLRLQIWLIKYLSGMVKYDLCLRRSVTSNCRPSVPEAAVASVALNLYQLPPVALLDILIEDYLKLLDDPVAFQRGE